MSPVAPRSWASATARVRSLVPCCAAYACCGRWQLWRLALAEMVFTDTFSACCEFRFLAGPIRFSEFEVESRQFSVHIGTRRTRTRGTREASKELTPEQCVPDPPDGPSLRCHLTPNGSELTCADPHATRIALPTRRVAGSRQVQRRVRPPTPVRAIRELLRRRKESLHVPRTHLGTSAQSCVRFHSARNQRRDRPLLGSGDR